MRNFRNDLNDHEFGNVRKCIAAGFDRIAVICLNKRKLGNIERMVTTTLAPAEAQRVAYYLPNEFITQLYAWASEEPAGTGSQPKKRAIRLSGSR